MKNNQVRQIVLAALQRSEVPFSTPELLNVIDHAVTDRTLRRWLVGWVDEGIVERTGKKRGVRYLWVNRNPVTQFQFLHAVPEYRRASMMSQIRDLWTHSSTSIEGNTLTLGETFDVLELGLTISGKPLREHQEVIGHARAIDQLYALVISRQAVVREHLFELYRSVHAERVADIYKPAGVWKLEPNGCNAISAEDKPVYIQYAHPAHVDRLMAEYLQTLNRIMAAGVDAEEAVECYAKLHIGFAHIHPFWDGNGRLARLISNVPLLRSGLPPLVIDEALRGEYIKSLAAYQIETGVLTPERGVWPAVAPYERFLELCQSCYQQTIELIEQVQS